MKLRKALRKMMIFTWLIDKGSNYPCETTNAKDEL